MARFLNASRCCCSSAAISSARRARSRSARLQLGEFLLQRLPLRGTLGRVAVQRDQLGTSRLGLGAKPALGLRPAAGGRAVTKPATTKAPTASPTNKTKAYSMVVSVRFLPPGSATEQK
ncbi:MAG: hypothetical protein ACLR76_00835 [Alistipes sp.]